MVIVTENISLSILAVNPSVVIHCYFLQQLFDSENHMESSSEVPAAGKMQFCFVFSLPYCV